MGAASFVAKGKGKTAAIAFRYAVHEAQYDYGHAGYTGTIAEKRNFVMVPLPAGVDPRQYAYQLIENDDSVADKWGPAGCFDLGNEEYLFFGWASS